MRLFLSLMALSIACPWLVACQASPSNAGPLVPPAGDPDAVVADIQSAYAVTPTDSRYNAYKYACGRKMRSRVMLRRQSENLLFRHPDHVDARMAAALLAYEAGDPIEAARHLDHLLRVEPSSPDAVWLRARIAMEEGNTELALRLLDAQIKLRPDHPGLREARASALYLTGDLDGASEALDEAGRLGAAPGRVAYHRGLLAEESQDIGQATCHYHTALEHVPGWNLPTERLIGLGAYLPGEDSQAVAQATPVAEKKELLPKIYTELKVSFPKSPPPKSD